MVEWKLVWFLFINAWIENIPFKTRIKLRHFVTWSEKVRLDVVHKDDVVKGGGQWFCDDTIKALLQKMYQRSDCKIVKNIYRYKDELTSFYVIDLKL